MCTTLVYYGEHYVVDVLAGAVLAALVMAGCGLWERRRSRSRAVDLDPAGLAHD